MHLSILHEKTNTEYGRRNGLIWDWTRLFLRRKSNNNTLWNMWDFIYKKKIYIRWKYYVKNNMTVILDVDFSVFRLFFFLKTWFCFFVICPPVLHGSDEKAMWQLNIINIVYIINDSCASYVKVLFTMICEKIRIHLWSPKSTLCPSARIEMFVYILYIIILRVHI